MGSIGDTNLAGGHKNTDLSLNLSGGVGNLRATLAGDVAAYWRKVFDLNPVLVLPLDDVSGTTAEALIGSDGSYVGGPTLRAAGPSDAIPHAVDFDGTDDYVQLPSIDVWELGTFSVEFWIKAVAPGSGVAVAYGEGHSGDVSDLFQMRGRSSDNKLVVVFRDDANTVQLDFGSVADVFDDVWHHVVFAETSGSYTLYVDGASDSSGSYTRSAASMDRASLAARWSTVNDSFLTGRIGAFVAYDKELTATEVSDLYNAAQTS